MSVIEKTIVYGIGGFDPTKPNNNIVEEYEVEVPDPEPTPEEQIVALQDAVDTLTLALLELEP
jgi:hypothetical protein